MEYTAQGASAPEAVPSGESHNCAETCPIAEAAITGETNEDRRYELAMTAVTSGKASASGAAKQWKLSQERLSERVRAELSKAEGGHVTRSGNMPTRQSPPKAEDILGRKQPVAKYDKEFKAAAVARVAKGESHVQVARDLAIGRKTLGAWVKAAAAATAADSPEESPLPPPQRELVKSPHAAGPDEIRDGVDEHVDWFMARHAKDFQALAAVDPVEPEAPPEQKASLAPDPPEKPAALPRKPKTAPDRPATHAAELKRLQRLLRASEALRILEQEFDNLARTRKGDSEGKLAAASSWHAGWVAHIEQHEPELVMSLLGEHSQAARPVVAAMNELRRRAEAVERFTKGALRAHGYIRWHPDQPCAMERMDWTAPC